MDPSKIKFPVHLGSMNPNICKTCQTELSPTLNSEKQKHLCDTCEEKLLHLTSAPNQAEMFLRIKCLDIFQMLLALFKMTLSHHFTIRIRPGEGIIVERSLGTPGIREMLPRVENLDPAAQELFDTALLTFTKCHWATTFLSEILIRELLGPGSPVSKIQEINFKPNTNLYNVHWIHRVFLNDGRSFAIGWTDRQLSWLPLITEWEDYKKQNIKHINIEDDPGTCLAGLTETILERLHEWIQAIPEQVQARYQALKELSPPPEYDMLFGEGSPAWVPANFTITGQTVAAEWLFNLHLAEHCVERYWDMWKKGDWKDLGFEREEELLKLCDLG